MATESVRYRVNPFVRGEWRDGSNAIEVTDLSTNRTFAVTRAADETDAEAALDAAADATAAMRETTVPERAEWCETVAARLRDRSEELAEVVVREAGKPIASAQSEVASAAERFDRAAEEVRGLRGEFRPGTTAGHEAWEAIVKYEPMGVVLCIAPYNYPLATTAMMIAPALAAGNSVVLKPANQTPVSGSLLAEIVGDLPLPSGAFNYVPSRSAVVGDTLAGDDRVDTIALTGSSQAGEHVARESGIVNLHLELGGNAPAVVFPDADLDEAARACAKGSFKYAGQRCSAVSRILVQKAVADELTSRLEAELDEWRLGDLFDEETAVGPLISPEHAEWVDSLVADAVERGGTLVRGGDRDGRRYEPTLLTDVPSDARILHEEQFGPVAVVTSFEEWDDAREIIESGDLALDGCVFTSDYDRALTVADQINAGAVRINGVPSHGIGDIPFGGNDGSGIGREGLDRNIRSMVREKSIVL